MSKKQREYGSALERARSRFRRLGFDDVEPYDVYNHLPAVNVHDGESVAVVTQQQADAIFDELIRQAPSFKNSKIDAKRIFFRQLIHAAKRAIHGCGCVRYTRNFRHPEFAKINVQVIDAAVEVGLFKDFRSPQGSPKESRLLPLEALARVTEKDHWEFDPVKSNQYVLLVDRESKKEVPFDPAQHIPLRVQRHLELVNSVVSQYRIDYLPWCEWMEERGPRTRLRPIHYAKFVDGFSLHGRLYTGRYGHQSLRKIERETIRFDGERSVEYDYQAMHPRFLYHFHERLPYDADPYALWGEETTAPQRLMAKTLINALINARSGDKAVAACNAAMSMKTKRGEWKRGKELRTATILGQAQVESGVTFKEVEKQAMKRHRRIKRHFGLDLGMVLMWLDGSIALYVLYHFAKIGVPCLSVLDSFIVPRSARVELRNVMQAFYEAHTGLSPIINPSIKTGV